MKSIRKYIMSVMALVAVLSLGSCAKETPFGIEEVREGRLITRSLKVDMSNTESVVRSAAAPTVDEFTIDFVKDGVVEASYIYAQLPEIITLPVGDYKVLAYYGENPAAAWDAPYYKGESEEFKIVEDEITDNISPIVCKLSNVKVTILIDESLRAAMSADSRITVNVGDGASLDFTPEDIQAGRSGFFAYVDNSHTLAATFSGLVEGYATNETKTYDNVAPGNHYRITFRLHSSDYTEPGSIDSQLTVDATVEVVDMNQNVDVDDPILEDDMRPKEEDPEPVIPPVGDKGPEITAEAPINLEIENDVPAGGMNCVLNIHSESGIQQFKVTISSETLTKDVLEDVGLSDKLDLVNPGSLAEGLEGLGLPCGDQVKGQNDVVFNITSFMDLLGVYGAAHHVFRLEVTDASGTTVKELKLRTF